MSIAYSKHWLHWQKAAATILISSFRRGGTWVKFWTVQTDQGNTISLILMWVVLSVLFERSWLANSTSKKQSMHCAAFFKGESGWWPPVASAPPLQRLQLWFCATNFYFFPHTEICPHFQEQPILICFQNWTLDCPVNDAHNDSDKIVYIVFCTLLCTFSWQPKLLLCSLVMENVALPFWTSVSSFCRLFSFRHPFLFFFLIPVVEEVAVYFLSVWSKLQTRGV